MRTDLSRMRMNLSRRMGRTSLMWRRMMHIRTGLPFFKMAARFCHLLYLLKKQPTILVLIFQRTLFSIISRSLLASVGILMGSCRHFLQLVCLHLHRFPTRLCLFLKLLSKGMGKLEGRDLCLCLVVMSIPGRLSREGLDHFTHMEIPIHIRITMDIGPTTYTSKEGLTMIGILSKLFMVHRLTSDINLILNALQNSSVVEVKASKIRRRGDWSKWLLPDVHNRPMLRTQPQGTSINVKTDNVEKDGPLDGEITSDSSRQLIGSPLTKNGVQSGVASRSETASDHGLTKRNFPEGDVIKGFLDIRINDMG